MNQNLIGIRVGFEFGFLVPNFYYYRYREKKLYQESRYIIGALARSEKTVVNWVIHNFIFIFIFTGEGIFNLVTNVLEIKIERTALESKSKYCGNDPTPLWDFHIVFD